MKTQMMLICITTGHGNYHEPVFVTYLDHAKELKSHIEVRTKRYNDLLRKSCNSMGSYLSKCRVVSLWRCEVDDSKSTYFYNPYSKTPIIIGTTDLTNISIYDTKTWTIEKLKEFDKKFLEEHPDSKSFISKMKYFELDINKFMLDLQKEINELEKQTLSDDEDEYI